MTFSTGRLPFSQILFDSNLHSLFDKSLIELWKLSVEELVEDIAYMQNFKAKEVK